MKKQHRCIRIVLLISCKKQSKYRSFTDTRDRTVPFVISLLAPAYLLNEKDFYNANKGEFSFHPFSAALGGF